MSTSQRYIPRAEDVAQSGTPRLHDKTASQQRNKRFGISCDTRYDVDGSGEHAKGAKPDSKGHLRIGRATETESSLDGRAGAMLGVEPDSRECQSVRTRRRWQLHNTMNILNTTELGACA